MKTVTEAQNKKKEKEKEKKGQYSKQIFFKGIRENKKLAFLITWYHF